MKRILVVGGSGLLGKEIVALLLNLKFEVYVLTRTVGKFPQLAAMGATLVYGDLKDKKSLLSACQGMDAVISSAHSMIGKGKYSSEKIDKLGQLELVNAAVISGVKYFSFISVIGASKTHALDFYRNKSLVEAHIIASGMEYNIIRGSAFMEFHIKEMMGKSILEKGKVTILGKGINPSNFVSVNDVAQVVVLCLTNENKHNKSFDIGGPENLSRLEIIELYSTKIGKKIKVNHIPNWALKCMAFVIKPFHSGIGRVITLSELADRTDQTFDSKPVMDEFQLQATRVQDII
ncbi:MAG: SDR family oxidoreductase [Saprospiraceae bacterium]|nr:SDR family oxidoreductase [Saprospiraceae bacterium]